MVGYMYSFTFIFSLTSHWTTIVWWLIPWYPYDIICHGQSNENTMKNPFNPTKSSFSVHPIKKTIFPPVSAAPVTVHHGHPFPRRTCSFRIQGFRWPPHRRDLKLHLPDQSAHGKKGSTMHMHIIVIYSSLNRWMYAWMRECVHARR